LFNNLDGNKINNIQNLLRINFNSLKGSYLGISIINMKIGIPLVE